jgi:cytochrome P450
MRARLAMRKRYGRLFQTNDVLAGPMIHVADRALIEQMFKWKPAQYRVSEPRQVMEPVTGPESILLLDGERHMRMRKLMLPPFHGEAIARFAQLMEEITNREIDRWRTGETIRTRTVAQTVTLEVIIRTVFGITDPARIEEFKRLLPGLSTASPFLLLVQKDLGPRSPWGRFLARRDRVDQLLLAEIEERRGEPDADGRNDILSLLLSARDEDGNPLTDRELRDELVTLLLAGHETTATSIGWAFERLLRTPRALERLTEEVQAGESDEYMEATIKEILRVRPVVTEVFRAPSEPTELGGYLVEPGTQLAASIFLVQYDPELYPPDPEEFRPERPPLPRRRIRAARDEGRDRRDPEARPAASAARAERERALQGGHAAAEPRWRGGRRERQTLISALSASRTSPRRSGRGRCRPSRTCRA